MDTAHVTANGFDILLWLAFLYFAPRLLTCRPRVKRARRRRTAPTLVAADAPSVKPALKAA